MRRGEGTEADSLKVSGGEIETTNYYYLHLC